MVHIHATEIESFLDAPTDFEIEFTNIKTGRKEVSEFSTGWGFGLQFSVAEEDENLIRIEGASRNPRNPIYIALDKQMKKSRLSDVHFIVKVELLGDFRINAL